jgi:hypothetical protein
VRQRMPQQGSGVQTPSTQSWSRGQLTPAAARHAQAFAAHLGRPAGDPGARVGRAAPLEADLADGAARVVAVVRDASTLHTAFCGRAADALARVHAAVLAADLARGAVEGLTRGEAPALGTEEADLLTFVALARRRAVAAGADEARGAELALVRLTVAVVVEGVARLFPERTTVTARVAETFVDLTVAVVVLEVAELVAGARTAAAARESALAGGHARRAAAGLTRRAHDDLLCGVVVDHPIAVVVEAVAHLVGGDGLRGADGCAIVANAHTFGTDPWHTRVTVFTETGGRFIDHSVAVVVEGIAGLFLRLGRATADDDAAGITGRQADGADAPLPGDGACEVGLGRLLVDFAVAVVVVAVAGLGRGGEVREADEFALIADVVAGGALAPLTGRAPLIESGVVLVDLPVAVVVGAVTHLRARLSDGVADERAGFAGLPARGTCALPARIARLAAARIALIDLAITVVVEPVADVRREGIELHAGQRARLAVENAGGALTDEAGVAGRTFPEIFFIDLAVTVVVEPVADLLRRGDDGTALHPGIAAERLAAPTLALQLLRDAGLAGVRIAVVDFAVAVVVETVADFVRRLGVGDALRAGAGVHGVAEIGDALRGAGGADAESARLAVPAEALQAVVDVTVAVVVEPVAAFGRALELSSTDHAPDFAAPVALAAGATVARVARLTDHGHVFVDRPVAVVVQVVADLVAGDAVARAHDHPGDTGLLAAAAFTDAGHDTRGASAGVALVDLAVAVVVRLIAEFHAGGEVADAPHAAGDAARRPAGTAPGFAGIAGGTALGVAVVDLPVAVVVEVVAELGRRLDTLLAGERAVRAPREAIPTDAEPAGITGEEALGVIFVDCAVAVVVEVVAGLEARILAANAQKLAGNAGLHTGAAGALLIRLAIATALRIAFVEAFIAVVVRAVAALAAGLGPAQVCVARVAGAVAIVVGLIRIGGVRTIVADVADAVPVAVGLIGIGRGGAVVVTETAGVAVEIGADAPE